MMNWRRRKRTPVNAVTPTGETHTDGQVFLDLLERRGLAHAPTLRKELAQEVPFFAALAAAEIGEHGIPLTPAH